MPNKSANRSRQTSTGTSPAGWIPLFDNSPRQRCSIRRDTKAIDRSPFRWSTGSPVGSIVGSMVGGDCTADPLDRRLDRRLGPRFGLADAIGNSTGRTRVTVASAGSCPASKPPAAALGDSGSSRTDRSTSAPPRPSNVRRPSNFPRTSGVCRTSDANLGPVRDNDPTITIANNVAATTETTDAITTARRRSVRLPGDAFRTEFGWTTRRTSPSHSTFCSSANRLNIRRRKSGGDGPPAASLSNTSNARSSRSTVDSNPGSDIGLFNSVLRWVHESFTACKPCSTHVRSFSLARCIKLRAPWSPICSASAISIRLLPPS